MAQYKFIRAECWARKGPHQKNSTRRKPSADGILGELIRRPDACPHVSDPRPPEILYGDDPTEVWGQAYAQAAQAVDRAGAKLKSTALIMVVGVATYPVARSIVERDPGERQKFDRWNATTIAWLKEEYGTRLKLVVAHWDEAYPHVHYAVLPTLGPDRRIDIGEVHPGHRAEKKCSDARGSRREQKQAHQAAMTAFQDRYYESVAIAFGFARFGPKRQRLDRDQWRARTKQLQALAASHEKLRRDEEQIKAAAARRVAENAANAQKKAAEHVGAVEAAAAQKIEQVRQNALMRIRNLNAHNRALNDELTHRDALLAEQEERIAALEAILDEQGLGPARPG